jgi:hypothetical protein
MVGRTCPAPHRYAEEKKAETDRHFIALNGPMLECNAMCAQDKTCADCDRPQVRAGLSRREIGKATKAPRLSLRSLRRGSGEDLSSFCTRPPRGRATTINAARNDLFPGRDVAKRGIGEFQAKLPGA